jgi:hypothetical protein
MDEIIRKKALSQNIENYFEMKIVLLFLFINAFIFMFYCAFNVSQLCQPKSVDLASLELVIFLPHPLCLVDDWHAPP